MKFLSKIFLIFLFTCSACYAGYYTPGTGVRWNMNDLVVNSGGVVTFSSGSYIINDTVKIRTGDTLYITSDLTVKFALNTSLAVSGTLLLNPPTGVLFTALDTASKYSGVRIDSSNSTVIKKLTIEHGVALRISDCSIIVDSCVFRSMGFAASTFTNAAIVLARSGSTISNSKFLNNYRAAIQSGANVSVWAKITGNLFQGNDLYNLNVPQINLGPSGTDTLKILNNQILRASTNSGGIGFLPIGNLYAVISNNVIKNNRYGLTFSGGNTINVLVSYNQIDSNNTQNDPLLGGSGIAFSGGSASSQQNSRVTGNLIRWNLWGITIQNRSKPNIGNLTNADTSDNGKNVFFKNNNSSTPFIDLYNNSIDTIFAQGNSWGSSNTDSIAARIFDMADNPALGPVNYLPAITSVFSLSSNVPDKFILSQNYPNPFNPVTKINFVLPVSGLVKLNIFDISGKEVISLINNQMSPGTYSVTVNTAGLASGVYLYKLTELGDNHSFELTKRMVLIK
ncbi:hypothetical protein BH10BAC5_BH10BAC5_19650 [soil metagenome]